VGNFKSGFPYGVIRAVHEFCAWYGWEMILLTHESHRHLSFALKKQDLKNHEIKTPWRSLVNKSLLFESLQYLLFYFGNKGKVIDFAQSCEFFTNAKAYCPVCGSFITEFQPFGSVVVRQNARCGNCGSLERHRMIWPYLKYETDLFSPTPKKMLHIAPEGCLAKNISKYSQIDYLTADLNYSAMVKMDITNIQYPDNSFDVIYCSHVLEHIADDKQAIKELSRVLKPTGWAILQVPIKADLEETLEDVTITDPKEKERLFGHEDHVRQYGRDYKNRLEDAGFKVKVVSYLENFTKQQRDFYGLSKKDDIYFCTLQ
jgi:predicted SAM-dependent methyltransferase